MGLSLHTSFCAPSWVLKFPELTALSRGCFQHWGKEEFISPLPHRTSLIKHMAWCDTGGAGQGEPGAVSVLDETVDLSWAPKSCWLCRGASPASRRLWSCSVAKAIFQPFPNWWHSSPLTWVGGCLQHWGLKPAFSTPARMHLESCSSWWHPELTLPSFLFSPGNMLWTATGWSRRFLMSCVKSKKKQVGNQCCWSCIIFLSALWGFYSPKFVPCPRPPPCSSI